MRVVLAIVMGLMVPAAARAEDTMRCMGTILFDVDNHAMFHRRIIKSGESWGPVKSMEMDFKTGSTVICGSEGYCIPATSVNVSNCSFSAAFFNGKSKSYTAE